MPEDSSAFYDDLAEDYHLIFDDWSATIVRQAAALTPFLHGLGVPVGGRVLDASCGIGTQALGLAAAGFEVTGTDLSPGAVERARREAAARGLQVTFGVADLRRLGQEVDGRFDAVLSGDNSFAHMLTDADLAAASAGLVACTRPGGIALASVRPYDELVAERLPSTLPRVAGQPGARWASFQIWSWDDDGGAYDMEQLVLREHDGRWDVAGRTTRLRALRRAALLGAFEAAGLDDVAWHEPAVTGFYQPIATGRRPA